MCEKERREIKRIRRLAEKASYLDFSRGGQMRTSDSRILTFLKPPWEMAYLQFYLGRQ